MDRLVIFDYDGTLCATHEAIGFALETVFHTRMQHTPDPASVARAIGQGLTLAETIRQLHPAGAALPPGDLRAWQDDYIAVYREHATDRVTALPAALETVSHCAGRMSVAVLSNKGQEALESSLHHLGFAPHVDRVFADDGRSPKKPSAELYTRLIRPAFPTALPQSTLMVGDTRADLQFAKNAGIRSCWAAYGYGDPAECQAAGYEFKIDSPGEITWVLESLL